MTRRHFVACLAAIAASPYLIEKVEPVAVREEVRRLLAKLPPPDPRFGPLVALESVSPEIERMWRDPHFRLESASAWEIAA